MKSAILLSLASVAFVAAAPSPTDAPVCTSVLKGGAVGAELMKATGVAMGPKPTGCADYEVLIGMFEKEKSFRTKLNPA
jgi:hypothetical protein